MPELPLETITIRAFLGTQEGIHTLLLPNAFSSSGSKNVWMDRLGRVRRIDGTSAQGSAVTTDTGGSATRIRGLFPYRKTETDGTFTRQQIGVFDDGTDEYEVHTSTDNGANWTFRKDAGSGPVGISPDFCQFGNDLFICLPTTAPQLWDGASIANAGGSQSPTPSAAANATAGTLSGSYRWKLVSIQNDGTRDPGSAASGILERESTQADITWTADTDTSVVGYELYRTTGNGLVYYLVAYIDGRLTAAYTDNIADRVIITQRRLNEHGDAPPSGVYFAESHKQRVWWGRTNAAPRRAFYSDEGDGDSVYGENFIDFTDAESMGDVMTGMHGDFHGTLVVFLERSIWTVSGSGRIVGATRDWTRRRTNAVIGAVSHRAVSRVPRGAVYYDQHGSAQQTQEEMLVYLTPLGDIRLFDGDHDTIISTSVVDSLNLSYGSREKAWALHDLTRRQIVFCFPSASATECDKCVVWNYHWGVWYPWTPTTWGHGTVVESATLGQIILLGESATATGGITYQGFSGGTFNGTSIVAHFFTKTIYGPGSDGAPDPLHDRMWKWAEFAMLVPSSTSSVVDWYTAHAADGATSNGTVTLTLQTNAALAFQTFRRRLRDSDDDYLFSPGIRLRVNLSTDQDEGPALESVMLTFHTRPGLSRGLP